MGAQPQGKGIAMKTKIHFVKAAAAVLLLSLGCWIFLPGAREHAGEDGGAAVVLNLASGDSADSGPAVTWYCAMTQCGVSGLPNPGKCPKCGMDLIPTDASAPKTAPREFAFAADAAKLVRVETVRAARQPLSAAIALSGRVAEDETRRSVIAARFPGRIERLYLDHAGMRVRAGDHMADIYAPDLSLSLSTLLSAKNREERDDSVYSYLRDTDLDDTRARLLNRGLTDGQIDELIESDSMRTVFTIQSPMTGVVVERMATRGQYVQEGTPLFAIADLSQVWVELSAYETDLALLRFGQKASISVAAMPGEKFGGAVSFVSPVMDEGSRSVRVRLDVPNPKQLLKPGMLVKADISVPLTDDGLAAGGLWEDGEYVCPMHPLETSREPGDCPVCGMALVPAESLDMADAPPPGQPLAVPESALLATGLRTLVYVAKEGSDQVTRYEAREVTPGMRAGQLRVVLAGLEEGEEVVTEGAFQIDSAMQIQGKFSLMDSRGGDRDPYFGPGSHDGDPQPGWYAAMDRSDWNPRSGSAPVDLDALFAAYLDIAETLAADDADGAKANAGRLAQWPVPPGDVAAAAADSEFSGLMRELTAYTGGMAKADGLEAQRLAFRDLSGIMTRLARRYGAPAAGVHSIFCPMAFNDAGAFWLQREATVSNPYHGLEMLRCGWEVEALPGR